MCVKNLNIMKWINRNFSHTHITYYVKIFSMISSVLFLVHIVEFNRKVVVTDYEIVNDSDIKVILLWNSFFSWPDYNFGFQKSAFKVHGCPHSNCLLTNNKLLHPQHEFSAILFHGFEYSELLHGKPKRRGVDQLYVFFALESALRTPIPERMKDFYNITMTYRLDSDIPYPYFLVRDAIGDVVAPKSQVTWKNHEHTSKKIPRQLENKLSGKTKAIAWFVSNCNSMNNRENYVQQLRKHIDVDIYGACGDLTCPPDQEGNCEKMLARDYLFYLAFENSNCKDYVTEKILTPLLHDTVPVVYGGANYSHFLPPHSYIDATLYSPDELAELLLRLVKDRNLYAEYFWWKGVYTFKQNRAEESGELNGFCELCRVLSEPRKGKPLDVIEWWSE